MSDGDPAPAAAPDRATAAFRPCIVIPFYRHEGAIAGTLARLKSFGLRCWVVDDGSGAPADAVLRAIAAREADWVSLVVHAHNRGKGEAVMNGLRHARAAGFTHAVQIDADGQHDAADLPRLLALARAQPAALVTGIPVYDDSVPRARLYGRYLTHGLVWLHTLSVQIRDSMCGFRVYPLDSTLTVWDQDQVGRRMEFDTEIMVRMHWRGVPVVSMPTRVTYPADGVSHYHMLRENLRMTWMHVRLLAGMCLRAPALVSRRLRA